MKNRTRILICLAAMAAGVFVGCEDKEEENKGKSLVEMARPVSGAVPGAKPAEPVKLPLVTTGVSKGFWTTDYEAACKSAAENNSLILIYFCRSDVSQECQALGREVFLKDEWRSFAESRLVLMYVDFPNQAPEEVRDDPAALEKLGRQNVSLQQKYGVQGFPALLLVEADGTPVGEISASGTGGPLASVIRNVRRVLRQRETYLDGLLARMPAEQSAAIRAKRDRLEKLQAESEKVRQDANKRLQELAAQVREIAPEIESATIGWLMAECRTPEVRAKYDVAKAELEKTEKDLEQWLATNPSQSPENNVIYANFQNRLAEQRDIIADCLAGDE